MEFNNLADDPIDDLAKSSRLIMDGVELPLELSALLTTLKIPNALMFVGNRGLGKTQAAYCFAMGLNCQAEKQDNKFACGQCRSCKKIIAAMHPDIICVDQVKEKIKIAQIREIYGQIKTKPHEARFRMVLIKGADSMNKEASNALLKILEEPPERTFFILTAEGTDTLLPTILSRCRQVKFSPMDQSVMEQILITEHKVDRTMAKVTASLARGSLKKALMYAGIADVAENDDLTNWPELRGSIIRSIAALITGNYPESALALAERLSQTTQILGETLTILESFLRDIVVFNYNPEKIVNLDFKTLIGKTAPGISAQQAFDWIYELSLVEKKIKANAGIRLTLEAFLFTLIPAGQMNCPRTEPYHTDF